MAKEYIDHERGQKGLKPCAAAQVYKANAAPDWWPPGVEVSADASSTGSAGRGSGSLSAVVGVSVGHVAASSLRKLFDQLCPSRERPPLPA